MNTKVTLQQAADRIVSYCSTNGPGPHKASRLAIIIWPDKEFRSPQGAGAAATRVLKRIGCYWQARGSSWGWVISSVSLENRAGKGKNLIYDSDGDPLRDRV